MKTLNILVAMMVLGLTFAAQAERKYGMAGCGLGSIVFGKDKGISQQVMAGTTNGTGMQTFGITSGTSNCIDDGVVRRSKEAQLFIEINNEAVAKDISRGSGETLKSLSHLFQCQDSAKLGQGLQKKYGTIYPSQNVSPSDVTEGIINVIHQEKELATTCHI